MTDSEVRYEPTEKTNIYRDKESGALVNRNLEALRAYKLKKSQAKMLKDHNEKIAKMEESLSSLEKNMSEIKDILINRNHK